MKQWKSWNYPCFWLAWWELQSCYRTKFIWPFYHFLPLPFIFRFSWLLHYAYQRAHTWDKRKQVKIRELQEQQILSSKNNKRYTVPSALAALKTYSFQADNTPVLNMPISSWLNFKFARLHKRIKTWRVWDCQLTCWYVYTTYCKYYVNLVKCLNKF